MEETRKLLSNANETSHGSDHEISINKDTTTPGRSSTNIMQWLRKWSKIMNPFSGIRDRGEAFDRVALNIGRVGFVARALVWGCVGGVALNSAFNPEFEAEDAPGALEFVAANTGGEVIFSIFVILLFTYGIWRVFEGFYGLKAQPEDSKWKRIIEGYLVPIISGIVYFAFAGSCISSMKDGPVDENGDEESKEKKKEWTARVASLLIGQLFLTLISIVLFVVALAFCWVIIKRTYRKDLLMNRVNENRVAKYSIFVTATLGMLGRAILFASLGILLIRVAWQREQFSAGFNDALNQWRSNGVGKAVIVLDGILLIIFGVFSLLQVKYKNFLPYRDEQGGAFKGLNESNPNSRREGDSSREVESSPV